MCHKRKQACKKSPWRTCLRSSHVALACKEASCLIDGRHAPFFTFLSVLGRLFRRTMCHKRKQACNKCRLFYLQLPPAARLNKVPFK